MAFRPITSLAKLEAGKRYRIDFIIRAPFSANVLAAIDRLVMFGTGLNALLLAKFRNMTNLIVIDRTGAVPPDPNTADGRFPTWAYFVVFHATIGAKGPDGLVQATGGTTTSALTFRPTEPGALVIGLGTALIVIAGMLTIIIAAVVGFAIVGKNFFEEITEPTGKLIQSAVPLAILIIVGIALFQMRGT